MNVVVETRKFRHEVADMLPIEGFECASGGIFEHANRAASVDDKYPCSVHVQILFLQIYLFLVRFSTFSIQKIPLTIEVLGTMTGRKCKVLWQIAGDGCENPTYEQQNPINSCIFVANSH